MSWRCCSSTSSPMFEYDEHFEYSVDYAVPKKQYTGESCVVLVKGLAVGNKFSRPLLCVVTTVQFVLEEHSELLQSAVKSAVVPLCNRCDDTTVQPYCWL